MLQSQSIVVGDPLSLRNLITSLAQECRRTGDAEARALIAACAADVWSAATVRSRATPTYVTRDQRESLLRARAVIAGSKPASPVVEAAVDQILVTLQPQVANVAKIRGASLSCITHALWILGNARAEPRVDEDEILEIHQQTASGNDREFAVTKAISEWFGKLAGSSNSRIAPTAGSIVAAADVRLQQILHRALQIRDAQARRPRWPGDAH